jgi:hypothetical protein
MDVDETSTRRIDKRKQMKLPKYILLTALAWLVMSSAPAQASYFTCPVGKVCSFAVSASDNRTLEDPSVTDLLLDGDITGGPTTGDPPDFDPNSGLSLAAPLSELNNVGIVTAVMAPIYQSLFIVLDELDEVSPTPDKRMEVLVSTNGVDYVNPRGIDEYYLHYNANHDDALIDLTGIASIETPVTHVKIMGIYTSYVGLGCDDILSELPCDPVFDQEVHVLGIAGITAPEVSSVPVPAAFWLFGSGLLGLVGVTRRCRHK